MSPVRAVILVLSFVYVLHCSAVTFENVDSERWARIIKDGGASVSHNPRVHPLYMSLVDDNETFIQTCGCSVLDRLWIMTAAHCFTQVNVTYRVGVGAFRMKIPSSEYRYVDRIVIHPKFHYLVRVNDIALAKLRHYVPFNDWFHNTYIVKLPEPGESFIGNNECWAVGWGRTDVHDRNKKSNVLLEKKMPYVMGQLECRHNMLRKSRLESIFVNENNICAGGREGSVCDADSGGPLSCKSRGKWIVAGIGSWVGYENCSDLPGVFLAVEPYVPWISKVVGNTDSGRHTWN